MREMEAPEPKRGPGRPRKIYPMLRLMLRQKSLNAQSGKAARIRRRQIGFQTYGTLVQTPILRVWEASIFWVGFGCGLSNLRAIAHADCRRFVRWLRRCIRRHSWMRWLRVRVWKA